LVFGLRERPFDDSANYWRCSGIYVVVDETRFEKVTSPSRHDEEDKIGLLK
jgi:hypothetical protein